MKVYNSELFPALDNVVDALRTGVGHAEARDVAMSLYDDAYYTKNQESFAFCIASYLMGRDITRNEALNVMYYTFGLMSGDEWHYRIDVRGNNTVYFIHSHRNNGTIIAVGIGEKWNKMEVIDGAKCDEWRIKFFNEMH